VYHLSKIPVKKRKSSLHKQVCRLFFFFLPFFSCSAPEEFLGRVAVTSLRLTSLRSCRIPPGVPSFKNSRKKTKKQSSQTSLQTVFLFLPFFSCSAPEEFFGRVAVASLRLTSLRLCRIPPGVPSFKKFP